MAEKTPIYLVRLSSQYELNATFMRFQEHYESPKFRGRVFSREEFMDWYAKENGNFTYFEDWDGCNIPSYVLWPFYEGKFDPLTAKEKKILGAFQNMRGKFYIIGTRQKGRIDGLAHEIVHGLFYCYPDYQKQVRQCVRRFDTPVIRKELFGLGYHPAVIVDEINAYMLAGISSLKKTKLSDVRKLRIELRKIFQSHFGYALKDKKASFLLRQVHQVIL